jgi:hypothetical protein
MSPIAIAEAFPRSPSAGRYDRMFYSGMAVILALTVLVGFAPTYYLRFLGEAPMVTLSGKPMTPLVHLHGALFTTWILLFVVQTALIAAHRVKLHQRLGIAGTVLAAVMIVVGAKTAIASAAAGAAPPGVDPLAFLAIPIFDVLLFAGFFTAALLLRRKKEAHKRLMLLAYISIIVAAVARFPGVLPLGPLVFFGMAFTFLIFAIGYDWFSRGKVHRVYVWGGLCLVLSVPVRLLVSGTDAWLRLAHFLAG